MDIKKFLKIKRKRKKIVLKKDEHAQHDWFIALLVTIVTIIAIIILSAIIFAQISSIEEPEVSDFTLNNALINQKLLIETLDYYRVKEQNFTRYQKETPEAPEL